MYVVVIGPRTNAVLSTSNRSAEGVSISCALMEPAGPGTATAASVAMSATPATSLGRRTSSTDGTVERGMRSTRSTPRRHVGSVTDSGDVPRPDATIDLQLDGPLDLGGSLGPLVRGHGDRTIRPRERAGVVVDPDDRTA